MNHVLLARKIEAFSKEFSVKDGSFSAEAKLNFIKSKMDALAVSEDGAFSGCRVELNSWLSDEPLVLFAPSSWLPNEADDREGQPFLRLIDAMPTIEEANALLGAARRLSHQGIEFYGQCLMRRLTSKKDRSVEVVGNYMSDFDFKYKHCSNVERVRFDPRGQVYHQLEIDVTDRPSESERCRECLPAQKVFFNYGLLHELLHLVDRLDGKLLWEYECNLDYNGDTYSLAGFDDRLVCKMYVPESKMPLLKKGEYQ